MTLLRCSIVVRLSHDCHTTDLRLSYDATVARHTYEMGVTSIITYDDGHVLNMFKTLRQWFKTALSVVKHVRYTQDGPRKFPQFSIVDRSIVCQWSLDAMVMFRSCLTQLTM